ncbi:hypothetical protein TD95_002760 [Thielaviopsis punctulata]|uniref:Integral membrane protein n=1 Tax=Thielaviopsis punctulata TaxID=72032 RepID=A0A0F4ZC23_9PEZI|nr:hypothetical protein TD95_002760 [Thielaviopsis punctulata]
MPPSSPKPPAGFASCSRSRSRSFSLSFSAIPPPLRPILRAFLLGYVSSVGPRILALVFKALTAWSHKPSNPTAASSAKNSATATASTTTAAAAAKEKPVTLATLKQHLVKALLDGLKPRDFPVFCAVVVSGSALVSRWLATFISAYAGLQLLQLKPTRKSTVEQDPSSGLDIAVRPPPRSATVDFTLFAATRAVDVIVGELWARHRTRREALGKWTKVESFFSKAADPAVFAISSAAIMWAWFYYPDRLPREYNHWVTSAAAVDPRLIEALRRCRFGWLIYGEETGQASLLQGICAENNLPLEWGDPALTAPFPCPIVHPQCGRSCEAHGLYRFATTWLWMMKRYAPLMLALRLLRPPKSRVAVLATIKRALTSASRSSAVIALFTSLFYYGVCLSRTRIGPHIIGRDDAACTKIDGGIGVGVGCGLCGWSILLESAGKRKDLALFVAPKALGTVLPQTVDKSDRWKEAAVFAASTAILFTCVAENKTRVRGMLGRVLAKVLEK